MGNFHKNRRNKREKPPTIADLYPDLSPEEQQEAEYFLNRYLQIVWEITEESMRTENIDED